MKYFSSNTYNTFKNSLTQFKQFIIITYTVTGFYNNRNIPRIAEAILLRLVLILLIFVALTIVSAVVDSVLIQLRN